MTTDAVSGDRDGAAPAPGTPGPAPPSDAPDASPARRSTHPRPTSLRGRAARRRRHSDTAAPGELRATGEPGTIPPYPSGPAGAPKRRRRSRHQVRRRRSLLLAGIAGLTVIGIALASIGLSSVRSSTAGRYEGELGPDDPGYQAYVAPTPTMAVLHRAADGSLGGAWLLALEPGDAGGSVIVVPPASIVARPDGETTIADVFRDEGVAAAAQGLAEAVTVSVIEWVEVDDAQWTQLVGPVGQVDVTVDEAVDPWPAGRVTLDPGEVGAFLAARAEGETDLARMDRQQSFWNAWLPLVAQRGEGALPGEVSSGIGRFVRGVAQGGAAEVLPVGRVDRADGVSFRTDGARAGDLIARTVPFPTAPTPGARIRVRLLNGTSDSSLTALAAGALVASGAQISIAGNASTPDVEETSLIYTGEERAPLATWLQANIGFGRVEEVLSGQDGHVPSDDEIDVTVILGEDAEDLTER